MRQNDLSVFNDNRHHLFSYPITSDAQLNVEQIGWAGFKNGLFFFQSGLFFIHFEFLKRATICNKLIINNKLIIPISLDYITIHWADLYFVLKINPV
jgi:hypothetical protein